MADWNIYFYEMAHYEIFTFRDGWLWNNHVYKIAHCFWVISIWYHQWFPTSVDALYAEIQTDMIYMHNISVCYIVKLQFSKISTRLRKFH